MSEPALNRRPMIDLEEFDRRMRLTAAAEHEAAQTVEGAILSGETGEAGAPAAVIGGDYAEIEAALLRAARASGALNDLPADAAPILFPDLRAARDEDEDAGRASPFDASLFDIAPFSAARTGDAEADGPAFASLRDDALTSVAPVDRFVYVDDAAVSGEAAVADEEKRSRRPLYLMAAVAFAGAAGIVMSFALKQGADVAIAPVETAAVSSAPAPAAVTHALLDQPEAAQASASPAQAAPQQALAALQPQPSAVSGAAEPAAVVAAAASGLLSSPPYGAPGASGSTPAPVAASPVAAPSIAAPSIVMAPAEAKKVKTASVRPDGTLVRAEAAPARPAPETAARDAAKDAAVKDAAAKEPAKAAAAKAPAARTAALPPPRPTQANAQGAVKAAAKPREAKAAVHAEADKGARTATAAAAPQDIAPAPAPVEAAPAPKPSPLAFVDTAVSSITGATSKIFDWGRSAANLAHN